jgi:hypothetical protein
MAKMPAQQRLSNDGEDASAMLEKRGCNKGNDASATTATMQQHQQNDGLDASLMWVSTRNTCEDACMMVLAKQVQ